MSEQEIRVGQKWRRIKGRNVGAIILIVSYDRKHDDCRWRRAGTPMNPRAQACFGSYLRRDYELIGDES